MRRLVENDLGAFCDWIGVPAQSSPTVVPGTFPAETLTTDLLAWIGPERMLHTEYMRTPAADVAVRMIGYRAQIMRRYPGVSLTQVAVVLGKGRLRPADDPHTGFRLGLRTIYLRDADPEALMASADLAPLAVLAKGSQAERGRRFAATLELIRKQPEDRHDGLYEAAVTLATITLERSTIENIGKEMGVSIDEVVDFYDSTEIGRVLKERGREAGREEGVSQTLLVLLSARFGDQSGLEELAGRLARSGVPVEVVVRAIGEAEAPEDVVRALES